MYCIHVIDPASPARELFSFCWDEEDLPTLMDISFKNTPYLYYREAATLDLWDYDLSGTWTLIGAYDCYTKKFYKAQERIML